MDMDMPASLHRRHHSDYLMSTPYALDSPDMAVDSPQFSTPDILNSLRIFDESRKTKRKQRSMSTQGDEGVKRKRAGTRES